MSLLMIYSLNVLRYSIQYTCINLFQIYSIQYSIENPVIPPWTHFRLVTIHPHDPSQSSSTSPLSSASAAFLSLTFRGHQSSVAAPCSQYGDCWCRQHWGPFPLSGAHRVGAARDVRAHTEQMVRCNTWCLDTFQGKVKKKLIMKYNK